MPRKRYAPEQIINKFRQAEVLLSQGQTVAQACKTIKISEQTYYHWRREYGGMNTTQAKRLKDLEKENTRPKKLVADLSPDNAILKEVLNKSNQPGQVPSGRQPGPGHLGCFRETGLPGNRTTALYSALYQTSSG